MTQLNSQVIPRILNVSDVHVPILDNLKGLLKGLISIFRTDPDSHLRRRHQQQLFFECLLKYVI
jgi:hypothetical protein